MSDAENERIAVLEYQVGELRATLAETLVIVETLAAKARDEIAHQTPPVDAQFADTIRRLRDRLGQAPRS